MTHPKFWVLYHLTLLQIYFMEQWWHNTMILYLFCRELSILQIICQDFSSICHLQLYFNQTYFSNQSPPLLSLILVILPQYLSNRKYLWQIKLAAIASFVKVTCWSISKYSCESSWSSLLFLFYSNSKVPDLADNCVYRGYF
jgi:hypothetical protein